MRRLFPLFALLLLSCDADELQGPIAACDLVPESIEPAEGPSAGGTEVTVTGLFVAGSSDRDMQIRVGGADATWLSMERVGCDTCDACVDEALRCSDCDRECRGLADFEDSSGVVWEASACVETLVFETPAGTPGEAAVHIINSRGSNDSLRFTYVGTGDDDDSAGDDDDSAGDDDDSAGDDDDSAGDDDDSARGVR